jgi:CheY-like chemotaxis protein
VERGRGHGASYEDLAGGALPFINGTRATRITKGGLMASTFFCPYCCATQEKYEYQEDGKRKFRCASCGTPAEASGLREESTFGRAKVLCIDDDLLLLGLVKDIMEAHGLEALTASDGPSGLALAKAERPDLILVDVMMPKMGGFEVCQRLRADPNLKGTPIIIITAMADPELKTKGLGAGANLAIPKPFKPAQIITLVKKALELKAKGPPR